MPHVRASQTLLTFVLAMLLALQMQLGARADGERFGEVNFPISCSAAAQDQFNHAVAMLHSFFYPETIKAFGALAQQEPTCAMAYWGIAVSQRPNPLVGPFPGDVLKAGWEAIEKSASGSAEDGPRERVDRGDGCILRELRAMTAEETNRKLRGGNGTATRALPGRSRGGDLLRVALNEAADPADQTYAKPLTAAAILGELRTSASQSPRHPALHHTQLRLPGAGGAWRDRGEPLRAARAVAPHALHMPSHIYSTLGMWEDVIGSDLASDEKTIPPHRPHQSPGGRRCGRNPGRYHSLDFLMNAYLQTAQDRHAKRIVDTRNAMTEFPGGLPL